MRALVCLGALLALAACRGKSAPTDDRPLDDVERQDLLREQERVGKGETVGEALRFPKVVVGPQDVTINGHRAASRSDLDPAALKRVDPVFTWAKGLREHWKTLHPAETFDGRADVTFPEDLSLPAGASVVATLAFAGFPLGMTVHSGSATVVLDLAVPGPPRLADGGAAPPETTLQVCNPGAWQARMETARGDSIDPNSPLGSAIEFGLLAPTTPTTIPRHEYTPWQPVSGATLGSVAGGVCTGACRRVVVEASGPTTFHDAVPLLAAALRLSISHTLAFSSTCPTAAEAIDAGASGAPKTRPVLRAGKVSVNGRLASDVIERVVRGNYHRFENCLTWQPKARGRVVVSFSIGADGTVVRAADGGSDLPEPNAVQCIVRAFSSLEYPKPESGTVAVTYTLTVAPAE